MPPGFHRIVIDTNFIGGGHFKLRKFERIVGRLRQRGHTVVVPEVVIWEWAEHAHRVLDLAAQGAAAAATKVEPLVVDRSPAVEAPHVDQIVGRLTSLIVDISGTEIDDVEGGAALEAVREQVTQVGQGKGTREGTKTGAADALVLSTVLRSVALSSAVILCTGDRALEAAAAGIDNVTVVRDQNALWRWTQLNAPSIGLELNGEFPPPVADRTVEVPFESDIADRMAEFIENLSNEQIASGEAPTLLEEGATVRARVTAAVGRWREERQTDVQLRSVYSVHLGNLSVEYADVDVEPDDDDLPVDEVEEAEYDEDSYRLATADAYVSALVDLTVWYISETDGQLNDDSATVEVEIEVPVAVEFNDSWVPVDFEANDVADLSRVTDPH